MARWDPAHVTPRVYHGNLFPKFSTHVLSWVKLYHHAKFHRNPTSGLEGIMEQTYIHTDRQTDTQTDRLVGRRPTDRLRDRQTDISFIYIGNIYHA